MHVWEFAATTRNSLHVRSRCLFRQLRIFRLVSYCCGWAGPHWLKLLVSIPDTNTATFQVVRATFTNTKCIWNLRLLIQRPIARTFSIHSMHRNYSCIWIKLLGGWLLRPQNACMHTMLKLIQNKSSIKINIKNEESIRQPLTFSQYISAAYKMQGLVA